MSKNPPNEYDLSKEYGVLIIHSIKHGVFRVLFDKEDYNKIKNTHWNVELDVKGKFYVRNGKRGKLHRVIMNTPKELVVDHLNHDTLDNRKQNLRNCTITENNQNVNPFNNYPNKSTGFYGISIWKYNSNNKTYQYYKVQFKGVIKCFKELEDAKKYIKQLMEDYYEKYKEGGLNGRL